MDWYIYRQHETVIHVLKLKLLHANQNNRQIWPLLSNVFSSSYMNFYVKVCFNYLLHVFNLWSSDFTDHADSVFRPVADPSSLSFMPSSTLSNDTCENFWSPLTFSYLHMNVSSWNQWSGVILYYTITFFWNLQCIMWVGFFLT